MNPIFERALDKSLFTVLFAVSRVVGWVAHWNEMMADPSQKIGIPRWLYIGPPQRDAPVP